MSREWNWMELESSYDNSADDEGDDDGGNSGAHLSRARSRCNVHRMSSTVE